MRVVKKEKGNQEGMTVKRKVVQCRLGRREKRRRGVEGERGRRREGGGKGDESGRRGQEEWREGKGVMRDREVGRRVRRRGGRKKQGKEKCAGEETIGKGEERREEET